MKLIPTLAEGVVLRKGFIEDITLGRKCIINNDTYMLVKHFDGRNSLDDILELHKEELDYEHEINRQKVVDVLYELNTNFYINVKRPIWINYLLGYLEFMSDDHQFKGSYMNRICLDNLSISHVFIIFTLHPIIFQFTIVKLLLLFLIPFSSLFGIILISIILFNLATSIHEFAHYIAFLIQKKDKTGITLINFNSHYKVVFTKTNGINVGMISFAGPFAGTLFSIGFLILVSLIIQTGYIFTFYIIISYLLIGLNVLSVIPPSKDGKNIMQYGLRRKK